MHAHTYTCTPKAAGSCSTKPLRIFTPNSDLYSQGQAYLQSVVCTLYTTATFFPYPSADIPTKNLEQIPACFILTFRFYGKIICSTCEHITGGLLMTICSLCLTTISSLTHIHPTS